MERLERRENWSLFDPYMVKKHMGYSLEDYYDEKDEKAFTKKYLECEANTILERITVPYENKIKSIEAKIASRSKEDTSKGEGFANLAHNKSIQRAGQVKAEADPNDIFAKMLS